MAETAVNPEVETEETPAVEPEVEVEEEQAEAPEGEEEEQQEEEASEEKPVSRRQSLRIQQLLTKLREKEAPAERRQPEGGLDYKTALEADEETVKTLDADRRKYGESLYNQGLEQAKTIQFQTRLEVDAPRVEAKYPVLDKNSDNFNPLVADALNQMYLSSVGFDPKTGGVVNANVRYADYIESIMELSDEVATQRVAKTTKNIVKQAASTGLRPGGNSAKRLNLNQAPQNMTDEELKAVIAQGLGGK